MNARHPLSPAAPRLSLAWPPAETPAPTLAEVVIREIAADGTCRLTDGSEAVVAASCLLAPRAGDQALTVRIGAGQYVLHILERTPGGSATLRAPGAEELRLEQSAITLQARRRLDLTSLDAMAVACAGTLQQTAGNYFLHVAQALVEQLNQHISRAKLCSQEAEDLLTLHGGQVVFTAQRDLRMDAERINMG